VAENKSFVLNIGDGRRFRFSSYLPPLFAVVYSLLHDKSCSEDKQKEKEKREQMVQ
jgi:hypothetical protein